METATSGQATRVHINLLYGIRPAGPQPPNARRATAYIRKHAANGRSPPSSSQVSHPDSSRCSPQRLPSLRENARPASPLPLNAPSVLLDLPSLPLKDDRPRTRVLAPSNGRSAARVDLKRGHFSGKHTLNDSCIRASLGSEVRRFSSVQSENEGKQRRSRSPADRENAAKLQRISRGFRLDVKRLQAGMRDISRRTQSLVIGGWDEGKQKRTWTPSVEDQPWATFLSAVDSVTRVSSSILV